MSKNRNRSEGKLDLGLFFADLRRIVTLFDEKQRKIAQIQLFCNRFSVLGHAPRFGLYKGIKILILLALVGFTYDTRANSTIEKVVDLVNNGNLQLAEKIINEQLDNNIVTDSKIHFLAIKGDIRFYQQDLKSAIKLFHQALSLAEKTNNQKQIAEQCKNIALTHSELGEYGESLRWHQKTWKILIENDWQDSDIALSVLLGQGSIYGSIGAHEQSLETLNNAQKLAYTLEKFDALSDSYVRIATFQNKNKNHLAALNTLQLVDTVAMNDRSSLSWYYSLYADTLLKLNRTSEAQALIADILELDIQWLNSDFIAFEVILLESYLQGGDIFQATQSLNNFKNNSNDSESSWIFQFLLAKKYKLEKKHIQSFKTNLKAISIFFQYSSFNSNSTHSLFIHIPQDLVEATVIDAFDIGLANSNLMFELFYLAFLSKQPTQIKTGTISKVDTTLSNNAESSVIEDITLGEASLNFDNRLKVTELQAVLDKDQGFVFYLSIEEHFYTMLVTRNNIFSIQIQSQTSDIQNLSIQLLTQLENNNSNWMNTAYKLDSLLIKPLRLNGLEHLKRIHFIQDDNLRFLPMDLFLDDQGTLLSDRHQIAINTVKSLKKYIQAKQKQTNTTTASELNLIGLSDGNLQIPNFWQTAYRNINLSHNNLPNVNKELTHLKHWFPNSVMTKGKQATETQVKHIISNSSGILHFASHGFDNPIAPAYSALVLKADQSNDGLLQAREISKLFTNAELVVLASCSSAKGGLNGLYGYNSGVAESFIQAGAKTVIGTLWDVKDKTTYQFMQWFYHELSQELTVSKALSFAKKRARKAGWKAYDWAAFIVLGQADLKLKLEQTENHYIAIILSLLLLFTVILIWLNHRKFRP